ncbi:Na+/H+ antiporter NhaC [uncultured Fusobacterium sp.]|uniref:Na+/H+ antiporter NhaC n=1 Tax=uncultured Fusobacterium sp. TaxID=159267 RepID=UPI002804DC67|nr:Na+/H+ antiporter NhaC [uncultured Fusobacterium sp.]
MNEGSKVRLPNKVEAIIPIVFLLTVMITNYALGWGLDPHIPVTLSCGVAMIIGKLCGYDYKDMLAAGLEAVNQSLEAIIIILLVGCLIGSFTACGTIPAVVYYGLKLLTPAIFLPFVTILCAVVGIALGSAWTVTATLGIAFMAIGTTMGLNPALIAGAILSGACCGDKFSPLSDSTNLAAGSAQTGLFDHVAAMVTTTFPSLVIAVILYTFFSLSKVGTYDPSLATELSSAILDHYTYMSPILLIPILLIVVVAVIKMPAIPSVVLLSLLGCIFAIIFQGTGIADCIKILHYGYEAESSNALFYKLVNRGGMDSMLWTNNLVIVAVAFGGILQKIGSVESLLGGLIKKVKTPFQLVLVTIATGVFCITTMCDQYLGLIIPASMYKDNYDEMGLGRNMLSRTLEDGGTLWSPLVPWSSCGAYHAAVLGVPTLAYLPYCFMNIINPIYAIVTLSWGGNILYADGSRTNLFGKLKKGRGPAQAPEKAYEKAMKALARIRNSEGAKAL